MAVEIRPVAPEDDLRYRELMAQSFNRGEVQYPLSEGETPKLEGRWGLLEGGELRAAYTLCDFHVHWGGGQVLPMGGIAGVGSFAETRGRGHVASLLRHMLETMRARDQVISALYPFAFAYYRRFGWDWVGERRSVTLPLREVRAAPEGKNVRQVRAAEALEDLRRVYDTFARSYRGTFDLESHQWENVLRHRDGRTTYLYVHQAPGEAADGYLVWRFARDGDTGQVREFVANSPAAYRGLLSILHYFGTQCQKATLRLPADDPIWTHVMQWDVKTELWPVFMGRVVDVPAALESLKPEPDFPDGAVTIAVRDEYAPWNEGAWRVAVEGRNVSCTRCDATAGLTCDIQALSQAFWGMPSLVALRRAGRIEVSDERSLVWLSHLLSGPPVYTMDDF